MKIFLTLTLSLLTIFATISAQDTATGTALASAEVYFDFGKHALRPGDEPTLLALARQVGGIEYFEVQISAHTDSVGTLENNLSLSRRRAEAVKNFLVGQGIPAEYFTVSFFGKTRPAEDNSTEEGRQRNRRATVEIHQTSPMATIEGTVVDENTGLPLAGTVILHTKENRDSILTGASGFFKKNYPAGKVVGVDVFVECYFLKSEMLKAAPAAQPLKIEMTPALAGKKMDIKNLFYVGGRADLLENSKPELPKILRFMQLSPTLKIEIAGHVNFPNRPAVVEESPEYKLSTARAKLVYDYLAQNGIATDRLRYKGFGNWEMRYPLAVSEEHQAQNRRVEIRVLEGGCQ